jgi:glycerophosphoryl diester phosphodiesterase
MLSNDIDIIGKIEYLDIILTYFGFNLYQNLISLHLIKIIAMKNRTFTLSLFWILIQFSLQINAQTLDIQGHRGARGLLPENSINGFIKAVDLGVTTLEMDVVLSMDNFVVVSHEPYISNNICLGKNGMALEDVSPEATNIYKMNYDEVRKFDCGIIGNQNFPSQEKVTSYKPLLSEVVTIIEKHIENNNLKKVKYNIEIKSDKKWDNVFHPNPVKYSERVYEVITQNIPLERVVIQSFDARILQHLHKKDPSLTIAFLVENNLNYKKQIKSLGFKPAIYSPYFKLIDPKAIKSIQNMGIKVIPWTVNDPDEMKLLIEWGVDGIITDYPDRALKIVKR